MREETWCMGREVAGARHVLDNDVVQPKVDR